MRPCLGTRQNCAAQRGGLEKITSLEVSKQPIAQDGRTIQASPPMRHRACFCSMANYTVIKWDSNPPQPSCLVPAHSCLSICCRENLHSLKLWSWSKVHHQDLVRVPSSQLTELFLKPPLRGVPCTGTQCSSCEMPHLPRVKIQDNLQNKLALHFPKERRFTEMHFLQL